MKAFWKLSDQLNGLSVDRFKEMVQDMAARWHGPGSFEDCSMFVVGACSCMDHCGPLNNVQNFSMTFFDNIMDV